VANIEELSGIQQLTRVICSQCVQTRCDVTTKTSTSGRPGEANETPPPATGASPTQGAVTCVPGTQWQATCAVGHQLGRACADRLQRGDAQKQQL
jgi:hypothetical protein